MNRYEIRRKIGQGSFGSVHVVVQRRTQRNYVVKEIRMSQLNKRERGDVAKEVDLLSKLVHPNIVEYVESFEHLSAGMFYIVMEYCENGDLYSKINRQRGRLFPEPVILTIFVQICRAVQYIHERRILHRDIKSQNIFIAAPKHGQWVIKLGDFGIAKIMDGSTDYAKTCIGTPYYLSPEVWENKPYNNKSDLWALGCVLYEMSTLKHAFEAGCMKNLILKIIRGSYPPLSNRYSYDLRNLVAALLRKNPRDRPSLNAILRKGFVRKAEENLYSGRPDRNLDRDGSTVRAEKIYIRNAAALSKGNRRSQHSGGVSGGEESPLKSAGGHLRRRDEDEEADPGDDTVSFIRILTNERNHLKNAELDDSGCYMVAMVDKDPDKASSGGAGEDDRRLVFRAKPGQCRSRRRRCNSDRGNCGGIPASTAVVLEGLRTPGSKGREGGHNHQRGCVMWIDLSDESGKKSSSPKKAFPSSETYVLNSCRSVGGGGGGGSLAEVSEPTSSTPDTDTDDDDDDDDHTSSSSSSLSTVIAVHRHQGPIGGGARPDDDDLYHGHHHHQAVVPPGPPPRPTAIKTSWFRPSTTPARRLQRRRSLPMTFLGRIRRFMCTNMGAKVFENVEGKEGRPERPGFKAGSTTTTTTTSDLNFVDDDDDGVVRPQALGDTTSTRVADDRSLSPLWNPAASSRPPSDRTPSWLPDGPAVRSDGSVVPLEAEEDRELPEETLVPETRLAAFVEPGVLHEVGLLDGDPTEETKVRTTTTTTTTTTRRRARSLPNLATTTTTLPEGPSPVHGEGETDHEVPDVLPERDDDVHLDHLQVLTSSGYDDDDDDDQDFEEDSDDSDDDWHSNDDEVKPELLRRCPESLEFSSLLETRRVYLESKLGTAKFVEVYNLIAELYEKPDDDQLTFSHLRGVVGVEDAAGTIDDVIQLVMADHFVHAGRRRPWENHP